MHFNAQRSVAVELIDPATGARIPWRDGAEGEAVYTTFEREATPALRYRSADHVVVMSTSCACGRTSPKIRCIGRTDDMLIYKAMNVFPSAIRDIVLSKFSDVVEPYMRIWKDRVEPGEVRRTYTPRDRASARNCFVIAVEDRTGHRGGSAQSAASSHQNRFGGTWNHTAERLQDGPGARQAGPNGRDVTPNLSDGARILPCRADHQLPGSIEFVNANDDACYHQHDRPDVERAPSRGAMSR